MQKTRFLTLRYTQDNFQNVFLIKDVGMIPYILYEKYGYDSTIAFAKYEEYPHAQKEVKGLKLDFIKQITRNRFLNALLYILKNARNYDILNLYHYGMEAYIIGFIYKSINRKGVLYIKLDIDPYIVVKMKKNSWLKQKIHEIITHDRTIVSAEIREACRILKNLRFPHIKYITNGVYFKERKTVEFASKRNEILFVGRIGSNPKDTETLLKGFREAYKQLPCWDLVLVGPIEKNECNFQKYLDEFFQENPEMIDRVKITGNIEDREVLAKHYESAKIFCLTSLRESFGIVLVEAMSKGAYIISTEIISADEITGNGMYGSLFPIGDYRRLSELMISVGHNEELLKKNCAEVQEYIYQKYNWEKICGRLDRFIREERMKIYRES